MEYGEDRVIEVAIKTLNQCPTKNDFNDFQREISVMKVHKDTHSTFIYRSYTNIHHHISGTEPPEHRQNHNINGHTTHSHCNGIC